MRRYQRHIAVLAVMVLSLLGRSDAQRNPQVEIKTNIGDIVVELYPDQAPITVDNYLAYVNADFYNGLLFHRVIKDFMIQGGYLFYSGGNFYYFPTNDPIVNESDNGLSNLRGTLAMARTTEPDSATAQFFINHVDNLFLDRANASDGVGYCVFGSVVSGMDVVDAIADLPVVATAFSGAFPYNPMVVMYDVNVLPCDEVQCSDFNGDGIVNFCDLAMFSEKWLDNGPCNSANEFCNGCDLDYSGSLDGIDVGIFAGNWLAATGD